LDVVPNSQYYIQVYITDDNLDHRREQIMYTLTPSSSKNSLKLKIRALVPFWDDFYVCLQNLEPNIAPDLDLENPMVITSNSVFVQWKFDFVNCSKLNGLFSKFFVELKVAIYYYRT